MNKSPWLPLPRNTAPPAPGALPVFCFPYAGGAASAYRDWVRLAPAWASVRPVQPPGREMRLAESPPASMEELVEGFRAAAGDLLHAGPYALFGHSLGGLVVYEVTRALQRDGEPLPTRVVVSGARPPHYPPDAEPIHHLPREGFLAGLRELGGTPEEVLASEELMTLLEPVLRADLRISEIYTRPDAEPLDVPLDVFGGTRDAEVPVDWLDAWEKATTREFTKHVFEGDHFFLHAQRDAVLARLFDVLAPR